MFVTTSIQMIFLLNHEYSDHTDTREAEANVREFAPIWKLVIFHLKGGRHDRPVGNMLRNIHCYEIAVPLI